LRSLVPQPTGPAQAAFSPRGTVPGDCVRTTRAYLTTKGRGAEMDEWIIGLIAAGVAMGLITGFAAALTLVVTVVFGERQ